jgi:hypothetical protein
MFFGKRFVRTRLSPDLKKIWGFVPIRYLILATEGYIVFVDDDLEVDWKSTPEWDEEKAAERKNFDGILNRAAAIESNDWDHSDEQRTLNFKRQIGEAIARALDGNFDGAAEMLKRAEQYRSDTIAAAKRREAIKNQVAISNTWRRCFKNWTVVHYAIGISAILLSTLLASKPPWLGEINVSIVGWIVAALTGLLTFLTPDKKANKYVRAWSVLNTEITRYNADDEYTVEDILDACQYGQNIIHELAPTDRRRRGKA